MRYGADNLVINVQTETHTWTDTGNDNTRGPKLVSGKKRPLPR